MANDIIISEKFQPLFELLEGHHPEIDTVILTGGRGSTKSFNVAVVALKGVVSKSWRVLYSRFTNQSIGDSIKLEVSDKIPLLGYEKLVIDHERKLKCTIEDNNGLISFKGIKTGSKIQKANLKGLVNFNVFIVDEAEEIPDEDTFKKVYYSIRSTDRQNISILILNPTEKTHWIFKTFFKSRRVKAGFCGKKENVMYIHSSFKDAPPGAMPQNILDDYERLRKHDRPKYDNIVAGGWIDQPEGALFGLKELNRYDGSKFDPKSEEIDAITSFIDTADGGEDHLSMPIGFNIGPKVFVHDVVFTQDGTDVTPTLCAEKLNQYDVHQCRIESNMGGSMYRGLMRPHVKQSIQLLTSRARANKHVRITTLAGFVKEFFYFRDDYLPDSDYDLFMIALISYLKNGESEHDDAPDSVTGLAAFIRRQYRNLYPNTYLQGDDGYDKKEDLTNNKNEN